MTVVQRIDWCEINQSTADFSGIRLDLIMAMELLNEALRAAKATNADPHVIDRLEKAIEMLER